jgi:hypothetical protein
VDLDPVADLEDRSGAEEADAGRQPLDDAAERRAVRARLDLGEDEECRPEAHQYVRPQSRGAVDALALRPEQGPEARRQGQSDRRECQHLRGGPVQ